LYADCAAKSAISELKFGASGNSEPLKSNFTITENQNQLLPGAPAATGGAAGALPIHRLPLTLTKNGVQV
jgi:hypothetical protein